MAVRPVVRLPERVLSERAHETSGTEDELVRDLIDTMRASPACVGLAAPQIGLARRAIVVDVTGHKKTTTCHGMVVLLNPVLVAESGRELGREGCMSVPDFTANVARATAVTVGGIGADGEGVVLETDGFEARAFQHEIDHLDGLLILDRVASLATDVFHRKVYE
ncbi:MAG TPA: peptide deformylase [Actinomycetota bacterium]